MMTELDQFMDKYQLTKLLCDVGRRPVHDDIIGPVHGEVGDVNCQKGAVFEVSNSGVSQGLPGAVKTPEAAKGNAVGNGESQ